jgi:hypothetical protein
MTSTTRTSLSSAQPPTHVGIADLHVQFGERWVLAYDIALAVWSTERRSPDGRTRWFICDRKAADLAARLIAVEAGK